MPSTSKKQHNFMAAVAKNPSFAKKAGIKPSVGEDFLKADKGKKFGGGSLKAGVANPKTRHGKMKFFSEGGNATSYEEGADEVTEVTPTAKRRTPKDDMEVSLDPEKTKRRSNLSEFGAAYAASRARGEKEFKYRGDAKHKEGQYSTGMKGEGKKEESPRRPAPAAARPAPAAARPAPAAARPAPAAPPPAAIIPAPRPATPTRSVVGTAQTPRGPEAITQYNMPAPDVAAEHARLVANEQARKQNNAAAMAAPAKAPQEYTAQQRQADFSRMNAIQSKLDAQRRTKGLIAQPHNWLQSLSQRQFLMSPEQEEQLSGENTFLRNRYNMVAAPQYAKGGSVGKYSKMEKEHVRQMKKHGVPEKYVKEEEKEAKGMKCGGMAKYARGGGVESKGKTQGKMIRMASGGMVGARADGIASRGKTKCKIR